MESLFNKLRFTADVLASDHSTTLLSSVAAGFEELTGRALELARFHSSEVQVRFTVRPDVSITSSCYVVFEGGTYAVDYLMDPGKASPDINKGEVPRGALAEIYAHRIQDGTSAGNIPPGVLFIQQLDGSKVAIRLNAITTAELPIEALLYQAFFLTDTNQIVIWNGTTYVSVSAAASWDSITGKPLTFPPTLPIAESDVTGLTADLTGEATARAAADVTLQTNINAKQNSLGFTPENIAHKDQANGYPSLDGAGLIPASELPNPSSSTKGGVMSKAAASNKFVTQIGTDGSVSLGQPDGSGLTGTVSLTAQVAGVLPAANGGLQAAPPSAVGQDGFFAPIGLSWLPVSSVDSTTGNQFVAATNNKVWFHQFRLDRPCVVGHLAVVVTQLLSPSTFDVGIYDTAKNLLCNLGGISGATTGNKTASFAQITLPAGSYYIAWTATSSGTLSTLSLREQTGTSMLQTGATTLLININGTRHGSAGNAATAGVLPATLGTLTATNTTDVYPPVMFCEP